MPLRRIPRMLRAISALAVALAAAATAGGRVIEVAGERLEFTPAPERGYVVKAAPDRPGVGILAATLFAEVGDGTPIRGLDRLGIWVVERPLPAGENSLAIESLWAVGGAQYLAPLFTFNDETVAVIPEIVIHVTAGTDIEQVQDICDDLDLAIIKPMEFTEVEYLLEVLGPDADAVFSAVEQLSEISFVAWACPNTAARMHLAGQVIPNDEYFSEQWHLHNTGQTCLYGWGGTPNVDINAPEAWEITTGDANTVVAVLDTGVDTNHPDLINSLVPGYDFCDNDDSAEPTDEHMTFHGTICAGLVAAKGDNSIGVAGVGWGCKVMPVRIAEGTEVERFIPDSDMATAIRWAASNGADVLSNSWGYLSPRPITHSGIIDVTRQGGSGRGGTGCVVLACSHNQGSRQIRYPAAYPEVIAVGATDNADVRWNYSNYGPELDIVAPGGALDLASFRKGTMCATDISGTGGQNNKWGAKLYGPLVSIDVDYAYMGGTSSACPVAAGVAALILSVEPKLTNEEVRHFLERSAKDLGDPGWDQYYGWGRVDARAALDMVLAKRADLNDDWKVNSHDFAVLARSWKTDGAEGDIGPAPRPDGFVDVQDVILMGQYWLEVIPSPGGHR
ncbi:MAG: S8 family serine peptidase [Phycisphaerales bacterium]|nr:MAG: S8 family serine peptidase [Phycisphaerales bacterium]